MQEFLRIGAFWMQNFAPLDGADSWHCPSRKVGSRENPQWNSLDILFPG